MLRGLLRCQQGGFGFLGAGAFDGSDFGVIQCAIIAGRVGITN